MSITGPETEIFSRVLFNDGEGIDPTDFNDVQDLVRAQMWDRFLGELVGSTFSAGGFSDPGIQGPIGLAGPFFQPGPPSSETAAKAYAYTPNPGCAMPMPEDSGTNRRFRITPGTLYQYLGSVDGVTPKFLPFRFTGAEIVDIANGDPSNPRVDLIQMALAVVDGTPTSRDFKDATTGAVTTTTPTKRRRIQCTLSVKQGTPAASPRYPDPDAGCCVIAAVYVGTNCTFAAFAGYDDAAGAVAVMHDQRMPLRSRPHSVHPTLFQYTGGYTQVNHMLVQKNTGGGEDLVVPLWHGTCARLLGAQIATYPATPPVVAKWFAERYDAVVGPPRTFLDTSFKLADTGIFFLGNVFSSAGVGVLAYHATHEPPAGPVILPSTGTGMGVPIWSNGKRAPTEPGRVASLNVNTGGIINPTGISWRYIAPGNGSQFGPVTFFLAEGL